MRIVGRLGTTRRRAFSERVLCKHLAYPTCWKKQGWAPIAPSFIGSLPLLCILFRQQQERNSSGCCVIQPEPESSHCSPGKLLARYRRAIYISELCTCFIAGDTKEYIWGVLMWSCSLFCKFLHLISLWDLGKVETGLWGHRKRSPSWGRISWLYGTVYTTCTWQSTL